MKLYPALGGSTETIPHPTDNARHKYAVKEFILGGGGR